jgi:hypothetical protein
MLTVARWLVRSGLTGGQSHCRAARMAGEAVPAAGHAAAGPNLQRLLALNARIWLNWQTGAPVNVH